MNELIALLIFAILALAWQLISDEPWTRVNRRAEIAASGVGSLGWVVERIMQTPQKEECSWGPVWGERLSSYPSLYESYLSFCPAEWTVDRLVGSVHKRIEKTDDEKQQERECGFSSPPDNLKWKARILLVMRSREAQGLECGYSTRISSGDFVFRAQVTSLIGERLENVLAAFTGHAFTPDETAQFYQVAELRSRRVENWKDSPLKREILGVKAQ